MPGVEGGQHVVADVFERPLRCDERTAQGVEPFVERMVAGLDEAVGVEGEQRALLQFDLDLLEGFAADAERHPGRDVEQHGRFAGLDHGRGDGRLLAKVHRRVTGS